MSSNEDGSDVVCAVGVGVRCQWCAQQERGRWSVRRRVVWRALTCVRRRCAWQNWLFDSAKTGFPLVLVASRPKLWLQSKLCPGSTPPKLPCSRGLHDQPRTHTTHPHTQPPRTQDVNAHTRTPVTSPRPPSTQPLKHHVSRNASPHAAEGDVKPVSVAERCTWLALPTLGAPNAPRG